MRIRNDERDVPSTRRPRDWDGGRIQGRKHARLRVLQPHGKHFEIRALMYVCVYACMYICMYE